MHNSEMPYRKVGKSGLSMSLFSLGGWVTFGGQLSDFNEIKKIHETAFEAGVNFFDIADIYARGESEIVMGKALSGFPRNELIISSKVFWPMSDDVNDKGLSRKHIFESVDRSLKRIRTDYLDIYFCHRFDPETPLEETVRAMDDLVRRGKILYWGTSEWTSSQLAECFQLCRAGGYYRPIVEQPQYSLLARDKFEKDTLPVLERLNLGATVWSPLASGVLTGKYDKGVSDGRLSRPNLAWLKETLVTQQNIDKVIKFKALAEAAGCSRSQLALAWAAAQPGVSSVILGASSPAQLKENLGALKVRLTPDLDKNLKSLFSY